MEIIILSFLQTEKMDITRDITRQDICKRSHAARTFRLYALNVSRSCECKTISLVIEERNVRNIKPRFNEDVRLKARFSLVNSSFSLTDFGVRTIGRRKKIYFQADDFQIILKLSMTTRRILSRLERSRTSRIPDAKQLLLLYYALVT